MTEEVLILESILCVNIPVQMISCTDTDGKITPMRFRFRDKTGELVTVTIEKVLSEDQDNTCYPFHLRLPSFTTNRFTWS